MPTLPKRITVVRAAVASLLLNLLRSGSLYSANGIANVLNIVAGKNGSSSTSTKVDTALLLCTFANDAEDEFVLV